LGLATDLGDIDHRLFLGSRRAIGRMVLSRGGLDCPALRSPRPILGRSTGLEHGLRVRVRFWVTVGLDQSHDAPGGDLEALEPAKTGDETR
jgi:hypothetical protein